MKKRLCFDMDNVLVDFQSGIDKLSPEVKAEYAGRYDEVPGIFSLMDPYPGAIKAFNTLCSYYDCYIVSTAPWNNPSAWADKPEWVKKYLKEAAYKRLTLTHHKELIDAEFLIDDRTVNGVSDFQGEHIHFETDEFPDWGPVVDYLVKKALDKSANEQIPSLPPLPPIPPPTRTFRSGFFGTTETPESKERRRQWAIKEGERLEENRRRGYKD